MEILGSTFDDSVFEESRNRISASLPHYEPKRCEPLWFSQDVNVADELEEQRTLKFRADVAYRSKQFQVALDHYSSCLALVPAGNTSVRRDVLEGIARSCCHLGRKDAALDACKTLRSDISNISHLTCVLQLELSISEQHRDLTSSISILRRLCSLHPHHPWHWLNLGMCYRRLVKSDAEGRLETRHVSGLKAVMCLIRTRLLVEILRVQQFSFVLENSQRVLRDIEEELNASQMDEETLQTISQVMAEDLNPEKMREESQDGESLSGLVIKDFDEKWWNKLYTQLQKKK